MEETRRKGTVAEASHSPLGCSCQGSGEADIILLIGSYCYETKLPTLRGIFFLSYWAKGSESFSLLSQLFLFFPLSIFYFGHVSIPSPQPFFSVGQHSCT